MNQAIATIICGQASFLYIYVDLASLKQSVKDLDESNNQGPADIYTRLPDQLLGLFLFFFLGFLGLLEQREQHAVIFCRWPRDVCRCHLLLIVERLDVLVET